VQLDSSEDAEAVVLPKGVILYEINGPLFFGAAQKAMGAFNRTQSNDFRVLVLHLGRVPVIDVTGLVALENMITDVIRHRRKVIIAGPLPRPQSVFERAGLEAKHKGLTIVDDLETGLVLAAKMVAGPVSLAPPP
jgi:SulP family sulfate permease